ncbi:hypothetical protein [Pseudobutyrivibrio sp.]|uniref:hypothetical protein n=1 Tax=Pseudobutyrivibrio sp. TaxID=2014367 RepID=UPI001D7F3534|nr:hypothetical protein [Pseudobutyrivibrio sp.]MBE5910368.1 hypothetical protein [Pseudobutyrivibrio sp.]
MKKRKLMLISCIISLTICGCAAEEKNETNMVESEQNTVQEEESHVEQEVPEDTEDTDDNLTGSYKDYFFNEENNEYTYNVTEFLYEDVSDVSVVVKELDSYEDGNVYSVNINYDDCPGRYYWETSDRFNLGTFYVTDEAIYVLFDRTDIPTVDEFVESGNIICSADIEQNIDGQKVTITNDGDTCRCLLSNTLTESGFYSEYEWTKGKGLTYFRSGYGAEGDPIEIHLQND